MNSVIDRISKLENRCCALNSLVDSTIGSIMGHAVSDGHTYGSKNGAWSRIDYNDLLNTPAQIVIDDHLDILSHNPVENNAITDSLSSKLEKTDIQSSDGSIRITNTSGNELDLLVNIDAHIKHIDDSTILENNNFYYRDNYLSFTTPKGLYANITDGEIKRVIQDLGTNSYSIFSGNTFFILWDEFDTHIIHSETSADDIVNIQFVNKIRGKTITILVNPLDKTLVIADIPSEQLADIQPNVWNLIYVHYVGTFNKIDLDIGTDGTVNIYDVVIKQPIIV